MGVNCFLSSAVLVNLFRNTTKVSNSMNSDARPEYCPNYWQGLYSLGAKNECQSFRIFLMFYLTHGSGTSYPQPCEKLPVSSADNRCRRFDPGQARWHSDGIPERTF